MQPAWLAAFEDLTTIQFNHRMFAYGLIVLISALSIAIWRRQQATQVKTAIVIMGAALITQVSLGIATLLHHVPVALAATHQGVAIVLLTSALFLAHSLRLPVR
jgi:cytochrome c oxidase assembly protein subunit 15